VERFDEKGYGLRYLLCGEPGTCKTKSVRTLIKNCYNKATIIICEGNAAFKTTFSFAQLFSLVIICIDDLDLYIGTRERNIMQNSLGSLLQELDGFRKNDMFLLATANDKDLIDKAASRPGRFDLVMDFNKINKENYMNLIRTSCTSEAVLKVLDDKLLKKLEDHHVTGAYIVNLIKQLEIKYMIDPDCDLKNYIGELIKLSYRGFYKKGERNEFGFIR
jgi:ATP-dependent 26S proteasome regulatory subunit